MTKLEKVFHTVKAHATAHVTDGRQQRRATTLHKLASVLGLALTVTLFAAAAEPAGYEVRFPE